VVGFRRQANAVELCRTCAALARPGAHLARGAVRGWGQGNNLLSSGANSPMRSDRIRFIAAFDQSYTEVETRLRGAVLQKDLCQAMRLLSRQPREGTPGHPRRQLIWPHQPAWNAGA